MSEQTTTRRGGIMTHKQGGLLFKFTLLKFWEPENQPPPTIAEASAMIDLCMQWMRASSEDKPALRAALVRLVNNFFPDWDGASLAPRFGHRRGSTARKTPESGPAEAPQELPFPDQPTPAEDKPTRKAARPEPTETAEKPEPTPEPESTEPQPDPTPAEKGKAAQELRALIEAGIRNIWMYGPAGCGKTTIAKQAAEAMEIPCTILSCNAGTSPAEIVGFKYPEPRPSPVSRAISQPGIIVLDEMPMLDPSVAAVANALLANGEMETSTGHATRNPDCIIIACANTTGHGADRVYIGNNQLDGATLDRFTGGLMSVDYDRDYESENYDTDVCRWVWHLREVADRAKLRRIISTRAIIAGHALKRAGLDWKARIVQDWTPDERRAVGMLGA
jgi:MoxR-like ATPase